MNKETDTRCAGQRAQQGPNKGHKMLQANILVSVLNTKLNLGLVVIIIKYDFIGIHMLIYEFNQEFSSFSGEDHYTKQRFFHFPL